MEDVSGSLVPLGGAFIGERGLSISHRKKKTRRGGKPLSKKKKRIYKDITNDLNGRVRRKSGEVRSQNGARSLQRGRTGLSQVSSERRAPKNREAKKEIAFKEHVFCACWRH